MTRFAPILLFALLGTVTLAPAYAAPQEGQRKLRGDDDDETEAPKSESKAVFASDGQPAAAGRVPEGTPKEAADLWRKLATGLSFAPVRAGDGAPTANAPRAFELEFSVINRAESGSQTINASLAYLELGEGFVRGTTLNTKDEPVQIQMRGTDARGSTGYWYKKLKGEGLTDGWLKLTMKDHRESRREIDNWAAIAYDIARLTDPSSFRIVNLQVRKLANDTNFDTGYLHFEGDTGVKLPNTDIEGVIDGRRKSLGRLASELLWLQLDTPDFELFASEGGPRRTYGAKRTTVRRLVLGLDPKTKEPQLIIVAAERDGPLQVPGTALVQCTEWFDHGPDGAKSRLPGRFYAYDTPVQDRPKSGVPRFSDTAIADLYLTDGGSMRAPLKASDFAPK